jgi:hypothetical protein
MAQLLQMSQSEVSKLERRTDMLLSTLRRFIQASCGELRLIVTYRDEPPIELEMAYPVGAAPARVEPEPQSARPVDFERWVISLVGATPSAEGSTDVGYDGIIDFLAGSKARGRVVVSVMASKRPTSAAVRSLKAVMQRTGAEMALLITTAKPSKGMIELASTVGSYKWDLTGAEFPRLQVISLADLLAGTVPQLPISAPIGSDGRRFAPDEQPTDA